MSAIEAVRSGMSALQAARKYGVPSRTLYDKVKKLGITTSRPFKRSSNGSGACFPYGIGGNANGSIYSGGLSESENENSSAGIGNPAMIDPNFGEGRELGEREAMMEMSRCSPSPVVHPMSQQPGTTDDQVEDLSVNRKPEIRVIVPPSITIKEEELDTSNNSNRN